MRRCFAAPTPQARRNIRHLLREHPVTRGSRLQCRPITRSREQRLPLRNDLVLHDLHSASKVLVWLQDRPVSRHVPQVCDPPRPIEVTPIPIGVLIASSATSPSCTHRPLRHGIDLRHMPPACDAHWRSGQVPPLLRPAPETCMPRMRACPLLLRSRSSDSSSSPRVPASG